MEGWDKTDDEYIVTRDTGKDAVLRYTEGRFGTGIRYKINKNSEISLTGGEIFMNTFKYLDNNGSKVVLKNGPYVELRFREGIELWGKHLIWSRLRQLYCKIYFVIGESKGIQIYVMRVRADQAIPLIGVTAMRLILLGHPKNSSRCPQRFRFLVVCHLCPECHFSFWPAFDELIFGG